MGALRYDGTGDPSRTPSGHMRRVNKVGMGEPVELDDGTLLWDDARFPNGTIDDDGVITPDEVTQ